MKFIIKLVAGLLGLVLTALLVVIAAVALFVDPNDYRDDIASAVQKQTGRELAIEGELSLGLMPCCAISLGETRLSNPPGFEQASFARVESARLGVQVFPLLTRQELLLDELELVGLQVDLLRLEDGRANWEFASDDSAEPATDSDDSATDSETGLSGLSISGIRIADARLSLRDIPAGTDIRIENLDLLTGTLEPGEPFEFDGSLRFIDGASGTEADLVLAADATLDDDNARIELRDVDGSISGSGEQTGSFELELTTAAAVVDLSDAVQADASDVGLGLELAGGELGADGQMSVTASAPQLRFDGALALNKPQLALEVAAAALPGGTAAGSLNMEQLGFDPDTGTIALRALRGSLQLAEADIDLTADGSLGTGATALAGDFQLAELSPRELLATLGEPLPETADPTVMTRLAAKGDWQLRDDSLALDGLAVQLDDSSLTGKISARNFDKPKLAFELAVDALNLDRYLAPESESAAEGQGAGRDQQEADLEGLRSLDLEGGLKVGALTVTNLLIEDLTARLTVRDGVIRLDPATARLYDGTYSGSVTVDASGPELELDLDQTLQGVQTVGLLSDFAEVDQLTGAMAARIRASGSGRNQDELLRNLKGDLSFDLADGVYQGMDIWHEIRRARALIRRKAPPARSGENQTVINTLTVQGKLADGVLRSQRMEAEIPFLRLSGDGALDVLSQELDYRFEAKVFETPTFPDGESYDDLTGLTIPVTISGAAEKPQIGVDLAALATNVAVQKATDKLFERLGIGKQEQQQEPAPTEGEPADTGEQAAPGQPQEEKKPRDVLRDSLRDLLRQ
jgi:AsmA protein